MDRKGQKHQFTYIYLTDSFSWMEKIENNLTFQQKLILNISLCKVHVVNITRTLLIFFSSNSKILV